MKYMQKINLSVPLTLLFFVLILIAVGFVVNQVSAVTNISTDVRTDGDIALTSAASEIIFANGWSISQIAAITDQLVVKDSTDTVVLVFDEN